MTSLKQIESNRRNALKSTGPKTDDGKQRCSRNAIRHGLTAETVIKQLEDPDDYRAFELAVTADYEAETAVERELVLRLASLLWRLRRATSIETGLLQRQNEDVLSEMRRGQFQGVQPDYRWNTSDDVIDNEVGSRSTTDSQGVQLDIAQCFLRLSDLDSGAFVRLGRYEDALWRQARQTLLTLERLNWQITGNHHRRGQPRRSRTMGRSLLEEKC